VAEVEEREVLLRLDTVARRMGISSRQVRNLILCGKLPGVRLSERNLRVKRGDLEDYLQKINLL
jgi:excisionase family DNA binding protein